MANHQIIICNEHAKRLHAASFDHYGDWVTEAKSIALRILDTKDLSFLSWHVSNGDLVVHTALTSRCRPYC